jgi:hypothetical protein
MYVYGDIVRIHKESSHHRQVAHIELEEPVLC